MLTRTLCLTGLILLILTARSATLGQDRREIPAKPNDTVVAEGKDGGKAEAKVTAVCGPDVTRNVLKVFKEMHDKFVKAKPEVQEAACDALVKYNVVTGDKAAQYAWDIYELFTEAGKFPKDGDPGSPSRWETLSGGVCCVPRYPCGKTVEFFGACHDMQVVNYVMWGITKALCSQYLTINLQQAAGELARNRKSPDKPEQDLMVEVGEQYGKQISQILELLRDRVRYQELIKRYQELKSQGEKASRDDWEGFLHELEIDLEIIEKPFKTDEEVTDPARFPKLEELVNSREKASTRSSKPCATTCMRKLKPDQLKALKDLKFTYRWIGLTQETGQGAGR